MSAKETRTFETETKKLLDLMIHSIYTHREIFLRELLSNASDALDKARFESIQSDKYNDDLDFGIVIAADKDKRTLTIADNGIGMTYDEVVANIGTIAKSGTKAFLEAAAKNKDGGGINLIGQFGVGFYSAFMVAERVVIVTKSVNGEGVRWESSGDGTYTIETCDRQKRGTDVILTLRKRDESGDGEKQDFLDEYEIKRLVKKYSDFIAYPIRMLATVYDDKGKEKELTVLNSMVSLWQRNRKDISVDEYHQFYKNHFHDFTDPLETIHIKAEGTLEYTALLFLPTKAPFYFFSPEYRKGVQLYSRNVFIMENCKELIPDYLRFVRGLVDSGDFSLNISREVLQHNRELAVIAKNIEKKVLETLSVMLAKDRPKYEAFWKEFGEAIKTGIYTDPDAKDKLKDLLLFASSRSGEGYTTLAEYVSRMDKDQKELWYAAGKNRETIERLPQTEALRERGIEVLYFTDRIDEFMAMNLREYNGKEIKSVSRGDFTAPLATEGKKDSPETKPDTGGLFQAISENLKDRVKEVRARKRLTVSAVCLVSDSHGMSIGMEQTLAAAGGAMSGIKASIILEINPNHPVVARLAEEFKEQGNSDMVKNYSELLYAQALIIEGYPPDNPADFAARLSDLMAKR